MLAVAAVGGAAVMIVELSAVRLLAPWFGASAAVWTNVIGVVLAALAVGYLGGARASRGAAPARALAVAFGAAGLWTLALPALAAPVARTFLGEELTLQRTSELFAWGSLAAAGCLFAPAAIAMGAIGPLAVELLQRGGEEHAGSAGGRVLAVSTLGSLCGTFAATHLAVPRLGLSGTFLATGATLVLVAVLGVRSLRVSAALLVASALLGATSRVRLPAPGGEARILAQAHSPYQFLRVVESGSGAERERWLQVNEGLDSFQSVWRERAGLLGPEYYYDWFAPPFAFRARDGAGPLRAWVLGFGAGTVHRVLTPEVLASERPLELTGVEIDARAVELARRWFDLPAEDSASGLRVLAGRDGRAALRAAPGDLDVIVLDAYQNQAEIPAHLASVEFVREVRTHLAPGGWFAANVGGFGFDDPLVAALGATIAAGFERRVLLLRVPNSRNVAMWAVAGGEPPQPGSSAWSLPGPIGATLLPRAALPGTWRWIEPPARAPLGDDRNPLEALQRESLRRGPALLLDAS